MFEFLRLLNAPCRDIAALVSLSMHQDLPRPQRWAVKLHLLYCKACRAFRRQGRLIRDAVRRLAAAVASGDLATGPQLAPEARERLRRALRGH